MRFDLNQLDSEDIIEEVLDYLICDSEEGFSCHKGKNGEHFIYISENQWEMLILKFGIRLT